MSDLHSPYRPPEATLDDGRWGTVPSSPNQVRREAIDVGEALQFPFREPDWWQNALVIGLIWMVPIVGAMVGMGWMRRIYEGVRAGRPASLPPVDFGEDLRRGWPPFVAMMSTIFGMYAVMFAGVFLIAGFAGAMSAIVGEEAAGAAIAVGSILIQIPIMLLFFLPYIFGGELIRRAMEGELVPGIRLAAMTRAIWNNGIQYIVTMAGFLIAFMFMYLGIFACFIGMFITLPIAMAMIAHLSAQWHTIAAEPNL